MKTNKIDKYDMQTEDYNRKARQKLQDSFDEHVQGVKDAWQLADESNGDNQSIAAYDDEMHHSECLTNLMKSNPCIIILSDADYRLINQLETN